MAETLTSSVMNVIVTYLRLRNYARPWSTYASCVLVQLSSQVAPILKAREALADTSCQVIASMSNAQACMQELATIKLFAAKKASTSLSFTLEGLHLPMPRNIPRLLIAPWMLPTHDDEDGLGTTIHRSWEIPIEDAVGDTNWDDVFSLA